MQLNGYGTKVIAKIATSMHTAQVLTTDGVLYGIGDNSLAQIDSTTVNKLVLSTNTLFNSSVLSASEMLVDVLQGSTNTIVRTNQGRWFVYGDTRSGQFGYQSTSPAYISVPTELSITGRKIASVSIFEGQSSIESSMIMLTDGCAYSYTQVSRSFDTNCSISIYGWGFNENNQLNIDMKNTGYLTSPVTFNLTAFGNERIVQLESGMGFSVALVTSGKLYTWGYQTGVGQLWSPKLVPFGYDQYGQTVVKVACGWYDCFAVLSNNNLIGWGYNDYCISIT